MKLENFAKVLSTIEASRTQSKILQAAGIKLSQQSLSIKVGNATEAFWKDEIKQASTEGAKHQVDLCFEKGNKKYYFELKCNTNLDSEKSKVTLSKVEDVTKQINADFGGIFNPVVEKDYNCPKVGKVYGVDSLIKLIEPSFNVEEYFKVLRDEVQKLFLGMNKA